MEHSRGKHKAKVFKSKLGIEQKDSSFLFTQLFRIVRSRSAEFIYEDNYGKRYYIDFELEFGNKKSRS